MKKVVYVILWVVLGLILSFVLHAEIEIWYLRFAEANNWTVNWILNGSCALPLWLFVLLPVLGVVFGIVLGQVAWRRSSATSEVRDRSPRRSLRRDA